MEGFTLAMALVDAIPVICFGTSMILLALRFQSLLFVLGAVTSTLAGCGKVLWKGILGVTGKNVKWLNAYFLPVQMTGFALILLSLLLGFRQWNLQAICASVAALPAAAFYGLWLVGMAIMIWFKKTRFDNTPRANWTAQIINCIAQGSLLLALLSGI